MKKVLIGFFSFVAVLTIGSFTESFTSQADHGRPPAPQRPDYISNVADLITVDHLRRHTNTAILISIMVSISKTKRGRDIYVLFCFILITTELYLK